MKTQSVVLSASLAIMAVILGLTPSARLAAQNSATKAHHHYKLIDLGTFGGPASYLSNGFDGILNNQGTLVGWADTPTAETNPAACVSADCFIVHAFETGNGVLTDLGPLPGGDSSQPTWISSNGLIAGISQIADVDPSIPGGPPEVRAVLWRNGVPINLGVFAEGGFDTLSSAVNSKGEVAGWGLNETPDDFSLAAPGFFRTQTRAFLWEHGEMQDLGTLGGFDAFATNINEAGQVAGMSYVNSMPNQSTGIPTQDPFLWEDGHMTDLGTLGGTVGAVSALNDRGQVVGQSNLARDQFSHPFLWTKNGGMQDLGTLGGPNGLTNWINESGDIVGKADLADPQNPPNHDAVLWAHGAMIDLGTLPGDSCSNAYFVNSRGQVVGTSENRDLCLVPTGERAFLWEAGGPMIDLNTLISPGSSLELTFAVAINNRGEIAGFGLPSGCAPDDVETCGHAYLLVPCDENHPGIEGCDYSVVDPEAVETSGGSNSIRKGISAPNQRLETSDAAESHSVFGSESNPLNQLFRRRFTFARRLNAPQANALVNPALTSGPNATLSPTSLTFSTRTIGTTSSSKTVTLSNMGTTSLSIASIAITGTNTGDFSQTHTCGSSLASTASCAISVTFKPTASGTRTAAVSVTDNASGSPQKVSLIGTGTAAKLSAGSLSFSTQTIGIASAGKSVTLTNVGTTSFNITAVAITGTNAGDYSQTHTCGSSLAASAGCTITVTFKPTASGTRTATLSVTDTAVGSPQTVPLTGSGTAAKLSPTSLNFGTIVVGTPSGVETVSLTNVGTTTFNITAIAITGSDSGDFSQTHTCGSSLTPGANCTISVTFKPTTTGTRTAAISVTDTGVGSPQAVSLTGSGESQDTLTGYCWGEVQRGAPLECGLGQDLSQCPAGRPAITPTFVAGCYPPQSRLVDLSRTCQFRTSTGLSGSGYCLATYSSASASGTSSDGSLISASKCEVEAGGVAQP